jgi:heme/copper-type cytochrome/quinol oxidase subunit 3
MVIAGIFLFFVTYYWWRDVTREATIIRFHTARVQKNLIIRIIWFISSEVLFFFRFFWTFFYSSLGVSADTRFSWPPYGLIVLDPSSVPLVNTVVLLRSSVTVTWSHYCLLIRNYSGAKLRLIVTITLRVIFTCLQRLEYYDSRFSIRDSAYRSIFFIATGFHRFHVLVGSIFLFISFIRIIRRQLNSMRHVGYECAVWYWHFVDTVWIYLYCFVYWWGSGFTDL